MVPDNIRTLLRRSIIALFKTLSRATDGDKMGTKYISGWANHTAIKPTVPLTIAHLQLTFDPGLLLIYKYPISCF